MAERASGSGFTQLQKDIASGALPHVILLAGSEAYLKEEGLRRLITHLAPPEARDFNFAEFDGADADSETVFAAAFAPPMFTPHRLVVLRRADRAPWRVSLASYLPELPESTFLVLTTGDDEASGRKGRPTDGDSGTAESKRDLADSAAGAGTTKAGSAKKGKDLAKVAASLGRRYDFSPMRPGDLVPHIVAAAKQLGLELAPGALEELRVKVPPNLRQNVTELEKIAAYLGPERSRVEAADVAAVVGRTALESIFALTDAVATGNTTQALLALNDLLGAGEATQYILHMLARQFRLLLTIKALGAESWPAERLFGPLETGSAWAVRKACDQARRLPQAVVEAALAAILRADVRLKQRRNIVPEVELQTLLVTLCRPSP